MQVLLFRLLNSKAEIRDFCYYRLHEMHYGCFESIALGLCGIDHCHCFRSSPISIANHDFILPASARRAQQIEASNAPCVLKESGKKRPLLLQLLGNSKRQGCSAALLLEADCSTAGTQMLASAYCSRFCSYSASLRAQVGPREKQSRHCFDFDLSPRIGKRR